MTTLTASKARSSLYRLLDETALSHKPIQILGKRHNAVLISEEDWNSLQETLYLTSISGMKEKIIRASKAPLSEFSKKLSW